MTPLGIDKKIDLLSARSIKASAFSQILTTFLGVIKIPLFAYFIDPKEFGLIAISAAITGIIHLLKDLGFSTYIIKQDDLEANEIKFIQTRIFFLGFFAFLATVLLTYPLYYIYGFKALLIIMPITGLQFILNSFLTVPFAILRKEMEFSKIAFIEVSSSLIALLVGILMLFLTNSYWVLIISNISYFVSQFVILLIRNKIIFTWYNPLNNYYSLRSTKYGSGVTLFNIFTYLSTNLDTFIIAKLAGAQVLGVYSKAYELGVSSTDKIRTPIQQVFFSTINKSKINISKYFYNYLLLLLNVLWVLIIPIIIILPFVVTKYLSSNWEPLIELIIPFLLTSFIWMPLALLDQILLIKKHVNNYLYLGIAKGCIGTIAIIFAAQWGASGIAWAFFFYHLIILLPFVWYVLFNSEYFNKNISQHFKRIIFYILLYLLPVCLIATSKLVLSIQYSLPILLVYCITVFIVLNKKDKIFFTFFLFMKSLAGKQFSS